MTRIGILLASLALGLLPLAAIAADQHVALSPDSLKWGPGSPALPKGAEAVILTGDPTKEGPYAYRLRVPAGYKVPPHQHPVDENVTVISGSFHIGMGDKFDEANGTMLKAGGTPIHNAREVVHGGAKVVGDKPLKILTTHTVDKGKPLYAEPKESTSTR